MPVALLLFFFFYDYKTLQFYTFFWVVCYLLGLFREVALNPPDAVIL